MSFQTPITIAEAIRNIEQNRYLLPSTTLVEALILSASHDQVSAMARGR